jgi:hypothetical protein
MAVDRRFRCCMSRIVEKKKGKKSGETRLARVRTETSWPHFAPYVVAPNLPSFSPNTPSRFIANSAHRTLAFDCHGYRTYLRVDEKNGICGDVFGG